MDRNERDEMKTTEIGPLCKKSAMRYCEYLKQQNKIMERIAVYEVVEEPEGYFRLTLSKRPKDPDAVLFEIEKIQYNGAQIAGVFFDEDARTLLVRPADAYREVLRGITADRVFVLSDRSSLILRVAEWYEENGTRLALLRRGAPSLTQKHLPAFLSEEQRAAVEGILSAPLSYIWGAPGTGKTKAVMADATVQYLRAGKRVLVVAPTHNALEQSLYGILEVLRAQRISLKQVLRLGVPSRRFATLYPDCCEYTGLQKRKMVLEQRKKHMEAQLEWAELADTVHIAETAIAPPLGALAQQIRRLQPLKDEWDRVREEIQRVREQRRQAQGEQALWNLQIAETKKRLTHDRGALLRWFLHARIQREEEKIKELCAWREETKREEERLEVRFGRLKEESDTLEQRIAREAFDHSALQVLQEKAGQKKELRLILKDLMPDTVCEVEEALAAFLQSGHAVLRKNGEKAPQEPPSILREKLAAIEREQSRLNQNAIGVRMQSVRLLAMTADSYLARFRFDARLRVDSDSFSFTPDHVFLDEAGYCSLIKGAALLANHCPITFLGDHLQLPPVCEMKEQDLKEQANQPVVLWALSALHTEALFTESLQELMQRHAAGGPVRFTHFQKYDLTATFRFGAALSGILDRMVYQNGFHSAAQNQTLELTVIAVQKERGERRRENPAEAREIARWVLQQLPEDYAILSPYTNQVQLIRNLLPKDQKTRVMTVHAAQGREWDTVVLSVSDTEDCWFTNSKNRCSNGLMVMNTAISRAKNHLMVVCDRAYWKDHPDQLLGALVGAATDQEVKKK